MNDVDYILLVSRWLHLAAAFAAGGGALYALVAFLPATSSVANTEERQKLMEAARRRWSRVTFLAIAILLVTGLFNFVWIAILPKVPAMPYHAIFFLKLLMAIFVFVLASALAGRSATFAGIRAKSGKWLKVLLVLIGLIILASGVLSQLRVGFLVDQTTGG